MMDGVRFWFFESLPGEVQRLVWLEFFIAVALVRAELCYKVNLICTVLPKTHCKNVQWAGRLLLAKLPIILPKAQKLVRFTYADAGILELPQVACPGVSDRPLFSFSTSSDDGKVRKFVADDEIVVKGCCVILETCFCYAAGIAGRRYCNRRMEPILSVRGLSVSQLLSLCRDKAKDQENQSGVQSGWFVYLQTEDTLIGTDQWIIGHHANLIGQPIVGLYSREARTAYRDGID